MDGKAMLIWKLEHEASENNVPLALSHQNMVLEFRDYAGKPLPDSLKKELQVQALFQHGDVLVDFPFVSGLPLVASQRAIGLLDRFLSSTTEVVPITCLNCADTNYAFIHVVNVLPCLDEKLSSFTYWRDGNIRRVSTYSFYNECIAGQNVFKIPQQLKSETYVSDAFKTEVEANKLTGLGFKKVWES